MPGAVNFLESCGSQELEKGTPESVRLRLPSGYTILERSWPEKQAGSRKKAPAEAEGRCTLQPGSFAKMEEDYELKQQNTITLHGEIRVIGVTTSFGLFIDNLLERIL
jgi:hypothetical protein